MPPGLRFVAALGIAAGAGLLAPQPAAAYSHTAIELEQLAVAASCVVQGLVTHTQSVREGPAIYTDATLDIERVTGECPVVDRQMRVRTFGGKVGYDEIAVSGIDPMAEGQRYVVLLAPDSGREGALAPIEGPQGILALRTFADDGIVAQDLAGHPIAAETLAPGTRFPAFSKFRAPMADAKAAADPAAASPGALFDYLSAGLTSASPDEKGRYREALIESLRGPAPGPADVEAGDSSPPLPTESPAAAPRKRRVECRTIDGGVNGPELLCPDTANYQIYTDNGLNPWNIPNTNYGAIAKSMLGEWNKYAFHASWLVTPTGTFGPGNLYNDVAGFISSATLQSLYGRSWQSSELGVTLTQTTCVEETEVTFLGVVLYTYCSRSSRESDVFLNPARTWENNDALVRTGLSTAYSVPATLLHELGHGSGLAQFTVPSIMAACDERKGAVLWPDDAAGIRARYPGLVRYGTSVGVRLVTPGGSYTCGNTAQTSLSNTSVFYYQSLRTLTVSGYSIINLDSQAVTNLAVEWYLTRSPNVFGTYLYLGSTTVPSAPPGVTPVAGATLSVPANAAAGSWYLTAYIRAPGVNSADRDSTGYVINIPAPAQIVGGFSRKTHGVAGTFDLPLRADLANPSIEPRSGGGGGNHTIALTFNKPVSGGSVTVDQGVAIAGTPTFSGYQMFIPLSNVNDRQYVQLSVANVTSYDGGAGGSGVFRIGFLAGDVNQNGVVTLSDELLVNASLSTSVSSANFLRDVDVSGTLSSADRQLVDSRLTRVLPAP